MAHVKQLYRQKLEETDRQIERLRELRKELSASVEYLETCEVCDPLKLISSCPRCDMHECGAPELVAGLHGSRTT